MVPVDAGEEPEKPRPPERTFAQMLVDIHHGQLHRELTEAVHEAVKTAKDRGKPSKVTLTLDFRPTSSGMFEVVDEVKLKTPPERRKPSMWYPDETGNLHRSDPHQPRLPFQEVPAAASRPVHDVPAQPPAAAVSAGSPPAP